MRQALERVPHRAVAGTDLVDGEVRLEHAALRREALDGVLVVAARGLHQLVAGRRTRLVLPSEAVDLHRDAAELGDDVGALRQLVNVAAPLGETSSPLPS